MAFCDEPVFGPHPQTTVSNDASIKERRSWRTEQMSRTETIGSMVPKIRAHLGRKLRRLPEVTTSLCCIKQFDINKGPRTGRVYRGWHMLGEFD
jgi:hypothetical protein